MDYGQLKQHFYGKDGVRPFVGVVTPPDTWVSKTEPPNVDYRNDIPWNGRCKVRIMGYHGYDNQTKLKDEDCPWAYILMPPSSGTSGRSLNADSYNFRGGERVFGVWLDEEDGQIPLVFGSFYTTSHAVEETTPTQAANSGDGFAFLNPTAEETFKTNDKHQPDTSSSYAAPAGSGGSNPTNSATITSIDAAAGGYTKADVEARKDAQKQVAQVTTCDPNVLGKIQVALEDFLNLLAQITSVIPNIPIVTPGDSNPNNRGGRLPANFNELSYPQQIAILRSNSEKSTFSTPVPPINECVDGSVEFVTMPCFDLTLIDQANWQPFDPRQTYINTATQTPANPNQIALSYALQILGYLQWIYNNFFQQLLGQVSDTLQQSLNSIPVNTRKFVRERTFNPLLDSLSCTLFNLLAALLPLILGLLGNMGGGGGGNRGRQKGRPIKAGPDMSTQFISCISEEVAAMYIQDVQPIIDEIDREIRNINERYGASGVTGTSSNFNNIAGGAAAALGLILLLLNIRNQCDMHRCEQPKTYKTGIKGNPEKAS